MIVRVFAIQAYIAYFQENLEFIITFLFYVYLFFHLFMLLLRLLFFSFCAIRLPHSPLHHSLSFSFSNSLTSTFTTTSKPAVCLGDDEVF